MRAPHFALSVWILLAAGTLAYADSTSLSMSSAPGDYIGGGQTYFFNSADGPFSATRNFANGVSLSFNTPTFSHWWYLDFAAPDNQFLTVGTYAGAVRFPFQPAGVAGLSVSGEGRGCNMLTGSFNVLEIVYGAGSEIVSFRATFEQHCEGIAPALTGEIRFHATVPVELSAPVGISALIGQNVNFTISAVETSGRHVNLSALGLPSGANFVDNGNNTGTFNWTPGSGQDGSYVVSFRGDNLAGTIETVTTRILVLTPPPLNDDISGATPISNLPVTLSQSTIAATTAFDDPYCWGNAATVWFAFTPTVNMTIEADTFGSNYDTTLGVYTRTSGPLLQIACNDNANGGQSRVRFPASAGVTYFFVVGAPYGFPGGQLVFNVHEGPPPLSINPTIFRFASLNASTGVAQVNGSVTCSAPTFVFMHGDVRQERGGKILSGFFTASVNCNGTTPWSAPVQMPLSLFRGRAAALLVGGSAEVSGDAFAFDPDLGQIQRSFTAEIILRGAR